MNKEIDLWKPITGLEKPFELAQSEIRSLLKIWNEQKDQLEDSDVFIEFQRKWIRRWSIETGILERIYDLNIGITKSLVEQGFKASLIPHGESNLDSEEVVEILNDHFEAHEFIMDIIGGTRELSISWIKELHQLITRHQRTTSAIDSMGNRIKIPLLKGNWKKYPNNPTLSDGTTIKYCPPEQVQSEMENLIKYYDEIPADYPEVRAAWLHHRFTQIHPFQDGNGRLARCLANIDFIKSGGFPIIVQREDRDDYIKALKQADNGELSFLIRFFTRLQKKAFLQAISISQDTIKKYRALDTILDAAETKIEHRRKTKREKTDEIANKLRELTVSFLTDQSQRMDERMSSVIDNFVVRVIKNQSNEEYYYRKQVLEIAKCFNYWVDFVESKYWIKLTIRDGNNCNFIVSIHQVGRPSQGTGAVVSFIEFTGNEEEIEEFNFVTCSHEPYVFTYEDSIVEIGEKFKEWLNESFLIGKTERQKRL